MELSPHEPKSMPTHNCISFSMRREAILKNVLCLSRLLSRTESQLPLAGCLGYIPFFFSNLLLFPHASGTTHCLNDF